VQIDIQSGDLTRQHVDAIVNAANSTLLGGGGVDGAIHAAAGPELLVECERIRGEHLPNGLPTGQAIVTGAGALPARFVIHTVGPKSWEHADGGADLLASCHIESLRRAMELDLKTVAFPAISCGVYGWFAQDAAPIAVRAVREFDESHPGHGIEVVRFVLFNDDALAHFTAAARDEPRLT
jgi:O-acetyl-ADP-ribose deacetylase